MYFQKSEKYLGFGLSVLSIVAIIACIYAHQRSGATGIPSRSSQGTRVRMADMYAGLPLRFEENRGQAGNRVKFLAQGRGYGLFLASGEAELALRSGSTSHADSKAGESRKTALAGIMKAEGAHGLGTMGGIPATAKSEKNTESAALVRLKLVGGNRGANPVGEDELPGKSNYFIGNDPKKWRTNVAQYARVKYEGVYPGIDLVYYGNQGQLENDFVLRPGADPKEIAFEISGASGLRIDDGGDLILELKNGELRLHKPVAYQDATLEQTGDKSRKLVAARYVQKSSNQFGFAVSGYDPAKPLVIDPVLTYSTFFGAQSDDFGGGIATDSSGNIYIVGNTLAPDDSDLTDLQGTPAAFESTRTGGCGICATPFIAKFNAAGTALVYATFLGGGETSSSATIAVDGSGNVAVTGSTRGQDFPTFNPFQATNRSTSFGPNAFVAKLNASGSALIFSTYLGGSQNDSGAAVAMDGPGNVYVTGLASSPDFPTTSNSFQPLNPNGATRAFVTKFTPDGTALAYSTFLGGSGFERGSGIAVDDAGNAYVTGFTASNDFPITPNAFQKTCNGGCSSVCCSTFVTNAFVVELNPSGTGLVYATYLGGGGDFASGIAVDKKGFAYVTGYTTSLSFPTLHAFQATNHGNNDAFVSKVSQDGSTLVYSTYLGGAADDKAHGIAVDGHGRAHVTGETFSSDFPTEAAVQPDNHTLCHPYCSDAFVTMLNPAGQGLNYSTYLGGSSTDWGTGLTVNGAGNTLVTGSTASFDFPTASPFEDSPTSIRNFRGYDIFVAKISEDGTPPPLPIVGSFSPAAGPVGSTVTVEGANFMRTTEVFFAGYPVVNFQVNSDTQLTLQVPDFSNNGVVSGPIGVSNSLGPLGVSSTDFKVTPTITSFTPASGPVGITVSIRGTALSGATSVAFNGMPVNLSCSPYNCLGGFSVNVPNGATSGPITVTTPRGTATSSTNFIVTTSGPPAISSFSPTSGPAGTMVTIVGTHFSYLSRVTFNGVMSYSAHAPSDTQVIAQVPTGATSGPISITTSTGTTTSSDNFIVTQ